MQVLYCIRVLRSVIALGEETVNQDLCDQGLINQLLGKLYSCLCLPNHGVMPNFNNAFKIQLLLL